MLIQIGPGRFLNADHIVEIRYVEGDRRPTIGADITLKLANGEKIRVEEGAEGVWAELTSYLGPVQRG